MDAPQLYLLPCSCGEKLRVRTRQAGEEVVCQCGAVVRVPTMRGLKQLETVKDTEFVTAPPRSSLQGPIFAIGLLALFAGCVLFAATVIWPPRELQINVHEVALTEAEIARSKIPVEELGAYDLYEEYLTLRSKTRSEHGTYAQSLVEAALYSQKSRLLTGGLIAGIGAVLTIVGLAMTTLTGKS
jgi:hypothetical protein